VNPISKFIRCHLSRWRKELRDDCDHGPAIVLHVLFGILMAVMAVLVLLLISLIVMAFVKAYSWKAIIAAPLYAIGVLLALAGFWRLGRNYGPPT